MQMGNGIVGLTLGYTFFGRLLSSILLGIVIVKVFLFHRKTTKPTLSYGSASKSLLLGGFVVWIPALITTLGIDLGTILLYGIEGPYESGIYFLTLAIVNAIHGIVSPYLQYLCPRLVLCLIVGKDSLGKQ